MINKKLFLVLVAFYGVRSHGFVVTSQAYPRFWLGSSLGSDTPMNEKTGKPHFPFRGVANILSCSAWITLSIITLSYHPDPKFVHCTTKHNVLTMAQAFAFPLAALIGSSSRWPLVASLTIMVISTGVFPRQFAFGYGLVTQSVRFWTSLAFMTAALLVIVAKPSSNQEPAEVLPVHRALGLMVFWLSIQPLIVPYPLATIPSTLGKRLSRAATPFWFLTASQIWQGRVNGLLGLGSLLHVILIVAKILGVDDGGLLVPGNGLWQWYPAMMAVPEALFVSCVIHGAIVWVCRNKMRIPTGE